MTLTSIQGHNHLPKFSMNFVLMECRQAVWDLLILAISYSFHLVRSTFKGENPTLAISPTRCLTVPCVCIVNVQFDISADNPDLHSRAQLFDKTETSLLFFLANFSVDLVRLDSYCFFFFFFFFFVFRFFVVVVLRM